MAIHIPCKEDGIDCVLRFPGCHALCPRWAVYEAKKKKADEKRRLDSQLNNHADTMNHEQHTKHRR